MKTGKNTQKESNCFRLLVLVPHRDVRLPLRAWGEAFGAWSFPQVVPLARLKRPLLDEELKPLAHALRQHIDNVGGKLIAGPPVLSALPIRLEGQPLPVFGPSLPLELPGDFFQALPDAITRRISPLVLGAALVYGSLPKDLPTPPPISFRAGALANMNCRLITLSDDSDADYLLEWKIGPLRWLPKDLTQSAQRSPSPQREDKVGGV